MHQPRIVANLKNKDYVRPHLPNNSARPGTLTLHAYLYSIAVTYVLICADDEQPSEPSMHHEPRHVILNIPPVNRLNPRSIMRLGSRN